VRLQELDKSKNPITSGIEPVTFKLVAFFFYFNIGGVESILGPLLEACSVVHHPAILARAQ
jgi:hypothetical protein